MKRHDEWRIAFRLLRSGNILFRSFSLFCVLGIVLVMSGFVLTDAVLSGFDLAYRRALIVFNGSAVIFKDRAILPDDSLLDPNHPVRQAAKAHGESIVPMPFYYTETLLINGGELKGLQVKGLRTQDMESALRRYRAVRIASSDAHRDATAPLAQEGVFLGRGLYRALSAHGEPPHHIRLFKFQKTPTAQRDSAEASSLMLTTQNLITLPVAGYFESGLSEFDDTFILMDENAFRHLVPSQGEPLSYHGIEWFRDEGGVVSDASLRDLRQSLDDETTFLDWKELNATFFEALSLEKKLFLFIAIAVMGIAILNVLILTLLQMVLRTHTSRIFEVLGASQTLIHRLFFKQVMILVGAAVGFGAVFAGGGMWILSRTVSIPLSKELYFLDHLPLVSRLAPLWMSGGILLVSASFAIVIAILLGRRLQSGYRLQ